MSLSKEKEILKKIVEGDRAAFASLYEMFSEQVYNTAISYAKNVHDAEEITQDVFVKIFRNASKFNWQSELSTWIYRITVNTSLNLIKKRNNQRKNLVDRELDVKIEFNHPGVLLENKENAAKLFAVLDTLVETQKTAFILSYIEGLPRKDVAAIMEVSLKAVESLLQRAKQNLRKELIKAYPNRRK